MVVLTPIERETLQVFFFFFFYIFHRCSMYPPLVIRQTSHAIVLLVPHACQHITVDQSHSSGDTVAKILEISGEWRHKDSVLHKPPQEKVVWGLNPRTGVATALTRHLLVLCVLYWTPCLLLLSPSGKSGQNFNSFSLYRRKNYHD